MASPNVSVRNGLSGGTYIGGTAATTVSASAIQVIADAKFHTLTGNIDGGMANETEGSAATLLAGTIIYGAFTAIKLHSGSVIAYKS